MEEPLDFTPLDFTPPVQKIYKDNAIWPAAFLGGPLAIGYILAENFKAFNEPGKAKTTWIYTIIATVIIFGGIFLIPEDINIPNQIIPIAYTAAAYGIMKSVQGEKITNHVNAGGPTFSGWRAALVGLIGLVITFSVLLIFVFIL